jgi:arylsulfatase A-like enzyme
VSVRGRGGAAARAALFAGSFALLCAGCSGEPERPLAESCVLITLDTTRRDALGLYGAPAEITPELDRFAAECAVFDQARSVAPLTLPAHASMLTGLYPPRHTVRDNSLTPVPGAAVTLAERAQDAGFSTGAVVAAAVLSRIFGLDQGFESYDEPSREGKGHSFAERDAAEVSAKALAWLAERPSGERFFLWAHYFDPHLPNEPGEPYLSRAGGDPYLGSVARMDAGIGALLAGLRARPDYDEILVIVIGDHGEGLGEHGEDTHSAFVYDSTLRVPLFVRFPAAAGLAGRRSDAPVSVADVYPTAVHALGLGAAGDIDGRSLWSAPAPARQVYFESYYGHIYHGWSTLAGATDGARKYVHASAPELYDLRADPGEMHNLAERRDLAPERSALATLVRGPSLAPAEQGVDPTLLAEIEKLGYVAGGGGVARADPLAPDVARPSPHARADVLVRIVRSWNLSTRGLYAEACRELEAVVELDPRNHGAWSRLGRLWLEQGQYAVAAQALERFAALGIDWPAEQLSLGLCYRRLGREEDALQALERGLALDPKNLRGLEELFGALQALGRDEEAAQAFGRLEAARATSGE